MTTTTECLIRVEADQGYGPWNVLIVSKGVALHSPLYPADAAMVAVFDPSYPGDARFGRAALGQFVSSYYADTFAGIPGGLNLHGAEPIWQMTTAQVAAVQADPAFVALL